MRAIRLRLPRSRYAWSLAVLVALSLFIFYKMVIDDFGPFDGEINFHTMTVYDRRDLGYGGPPPVREISGHPNGGYFDFYANTWNSDGYFGYCRYDVPYWPNGAPRIARQVPLPPKVQRHEIYSIDSRIPLIFLGLGWTAWACYIARHVLRRPTRGKGFEVLPASPILETPNPNQSTDFF